MYLDLLYFVIDISGLVVFMIFIMKHIKNHSDLD